MNDNKKMEALADSLLRDVNAADLPLGVKALALENLLLRVKLAMCATADPIPATEAEKEESHA